MNDPKSNAAEDYVEKSSDLSALKLKIETAMGPKMIFGAKPSPEEVKKAAPMPPIREQMELALGVEEGHKPT